MKIAIALAAAFGMAACASVELHPQQPVARTIAPYDARFGLSRLELPAGMPLVAASLDGKPAFCTIQPVFHQIGESRNVCLTDDAKTGYFDHYYVLGTLSSLTYDAHIPYAIDGNAMALQTAVQTEQANRAQCDYEAASASAGVPGLIPALITNANLHSLCMRAAAARTQLAPNTQ